MTANRSSAVMAQRHETRAPTDLLGQPILDDFPTPPWATRAVLAELRRRHEPLHLQRAWEPACNRGHLAKVLREEFDQVHATDVHDYGWDGQVETADFLIEWGQDAPDVDWVITNPPFRLAVDFIHQAMRVARRGVAVLVRTSFLEGGERYASLFEPTPPAIFMPFVERVVMWQGVLLDPDVPVWQVSAKTGEGAMRKPSTATAYAWLVWRRCEEKGHWPQGAVSELCHVAPCRRKLTRAGDYPPVPDHLTAPAGVLL